MRAGPPTGSPGRRSRKSEKRSSLVTPRVAALPGTHNAAGFAPEHDPPRSPNGVAVKSERVRALRCRKTCADRVISAPTKLAGASDAHSVTRSRTLAGQRGKARKGRPDRPHHLPRLQLGDAKRPFRPKPSKSRRKLCGARCAVLIKRCSFSGAMGRLLIVIGVKTLVQVPTSVRFETALHRVPVDRSRATTADFFKTGIRRDARNSLVRALFGNGLSNPTRHTRSRGQGVRPSKSRSRAQPG